MSKEPMISEEQAVGIVDNMFDYFEVQRPGVEDRKSSIAEVLEQVGLYDRCVRAAQRGRLDFDGRTITQHLQYSDLSGVDSLSWSNIGMATKIVRKGIDSDHMRMVEFIARATGVGSEKILQLKVHDATLAETLFLFFLNLGSA